MKKSIDMERISVNPHILDITDIESFLDISVGFQFRPVYYDVVIRLTPYACQQIMKYLITNHYVKIDGSVVFPQYFVKKASNGKSQEKTNKT